MIGLTHSASGSFRIEISAILISVKISIETFDPWFVGVIGGAGVLTALVPGSLILMATATLFANDLLAPLTGIANPDRIALIARASVPIWALVAVWFAIGGN